MKTPWLCFLTIPPVAIAAAAAGLIVHRADPVLSGLAALCSLGFVAALALILDLYAELRRLRRILEAAAQRERQARVSWTRRRPFPQDQSPGLSNACHNSAEHQTAAPEAAL